MSDHRCPNCAAYLKRVRQGENSMLNADQFDAIKRGDWFCDKCADHGETYRYFLESDLAAAASTPGAYERLARAERALARAGFTYLDGAAEWKPPLGKPPRFIEVDRSRAAEQEIRMAELDGASMNLIARVFKEFKKNACLPGDDRISESFIKAARVLLGASQANAQAAMTDAARDVLAERVRQMSVEGWTPDHDDEHSNFEMALAASYYAIHTAAAVLPEPSGNAPSKRYNMFQHADAVWPWAIAWRKPTDPRRNLVKAGALILAEIERLDRAASVPVSDLAIQMYMERHMATEAEAKAFFTASPSPSALSVDQIADIAGGCMDTGRYNMFMALIRHAARGQS